MTEDGFTFDGPGALPVERRMATALDDAARAERERIVGMITAYRNDCAVSCDQAREDGPDHEAEMWENHVSACDEILRRIGEMK